MTKAGLDLSINNTGICILHNNEYKYYLLTSKETRALKKANHPRFDYLTYNKTEDDDENIFQIKYKIKSLIAQYNIEHITIEAPALQAKGRATVSLAGLNYSIRQMLKELGISFTLVQPTTLKKWFSGNGQADKNLMCHCWRMLDPISKELKSIKVDDLADAYALCNWNGSH